MADDAIRARLSVLPADLRSLQDCIGQVLRQDVFAERENPPFDRVCMDGIAISAAAFDKGQRRFRIESTQAAGAPAIQLSDAGHAIEIMTGAMLPRGTDCIIPLEEYALEGDVAALKSDATARVFRNIQKRGEDSNRSVPMLKAGIRLGAPELAVIASAGLARVSVTRQPRIIAISTGDELIEPGEPILEHQIRRSNIYAIIGALRQRGYEHVANDHIRDQERALHERLSRHLEEQDVLILSGGVSQGKFDLVPQVLQALQVEQIFYQVAQRPGKPLYFGIGPAGQAVFGLPGNPVSTLISLIRYVVPALVIIAGGSWPIPRRIPLTSPVTFNRPVTYFLPVSVAAGEAVPEPGRGPGDFLALTRTNGFVELPPQPQPFAAGFSASFYPW